MIRRRWRYPPPPILGFTVLMGGRLRTQTLAWRCCILATFNYICLVSQQQLHIQDFYTTCSTKSVLSRRPTNLNPFRPTHAVSLCPMAVCVNSSVRGRVPNILEYTQLKFSQYLVYPLFFLGGQDTFGGWLPGSTTGRMYKECSSVLLTR